MARYGFGYTNASLNDAMNKITMGIRLALIEAFDNTIDELQDKIDELWTEWVQNVYAYDPIEYNRTGDILATYNNCPYKISKASSGNITGSVVAEIYADRSGIHVINNPQHHAMANDKWGFGNTDEGFEMLIYYTSQFHFDDLSFRDNLLDMLQKDFQPIYQKHVSLLTNGKGI